MRQRANQNPSDQIVSEGKLCAIPKRAGNYYAPASTLAVNPDEPLPISLVTRDTHSFSFWTSANLETAIILRPSEIQELKITRDAPPLMLRFLKDTGLPISLVTA